MPERKGILEEAGRKVKVKDEAGAVQSPKEKVKEKEKGKVKALAGDVGDLGRKAQNDLSQEQEVMPTTRQESEFSRAKFPL